MSRSLGEQMKECGKSTMEGQHEEFFRKVERETCKYCKLRDVLPIRMTDKIEQREEAVPDKKIVKDSGFDWFENEWKKDLEEE